MAPPPCAVEPLAKFEHAILDLEWGMVQLRALRHSQASSGLPADGAGGGQEADVRKLLGEAVGHAIDGLTVFTPFVERWCQSRSRLAAAQQALSLQVLKLARCALAALRGAWLHGSRQGAAGSRGAAADGWACPHPSRELRECCAVHPLLPLLEATLQDVLRPRWLAESQAAEGMGRAEGTRQPVPPGV